MRSSPILSCARTRPTSPWTSAWPGSPRPRYSRRSGREKISFEAHPAASLRRVLRRGLKHRFISMLRGWRGPMKGSHGPPRAAELIAKLQLAPHPEGGHYRETCRDTRLIEGRPASTAILFLLARGERSHWHRIDAVEVWHFYAGAPLALEIARHKNAPVTRVTVGIDLANGERPQAIVPAHAWQAAQSLGDWTLAGCTVAPGFDFEGFELAAKGWAPAQG